MSRADYRVSVAYRPGRWPQARREALVAELREVAAACFEEVPLYQALSGEQAELDRCVLGLARERSGRLVGFCSSLLLPVPGLGEVFHLGLTCIRPDVRGGGLTHRLTSTAASWYLLTRRPLSRVWVSNVACVLSSLGNVALYFEDVHPSPLRAGPPSAQHLAVARAISAHYRPSVAIHAGAVLDEERFVFRGSVPGTVFEKDAADQRFHHRDAGINGFYTGLLRFEAGDEVIQVGWMSVGAAVRYALRRVLGARGVRPAVSGPA